MKWFRHETDAHTNLKLQSVIEFLRLEGYGYYWACVELIGLQGENFRIKKEKNWKIYLKKMTGLDINTQDNYLKFFTGLNLIDKKANKIGDLYIPKLSERLDDYTNRVRRLSEHNPDNVPLQDNTVQDNTKQKKTQAKKTALTFELAKQNPLWEETIKKFPFRDYKFEFSKMLDWWQSERNKLPKNFSAFINWLQRTNPDPVLVKEFEQEKARAENERQRNDTTPKVSHETLNNLKEKMKTIGKVMVTKPVPVNLNDQANEAYKKYGI